MEKIDTMVNKYLIEGILDPKLLKIAKDSKGPMAGKELTKMLFLLLSDIYDLPDVQIVTMLKRLVPDVDSAKTILFIKRIRKAVAILEGKEEDTATE